MIGGDGDDEIGALNFNGIFFPEPGNDLIDGGEGDNCVFSGDGDDVVTAGDGSNLIVLGAGNDSAATGDGDNTVFGGAGADTVTTGAGNDVVALGAGDDKATLGSGNDIAWGEDGNDFIIGQYGDDSLYGGAGNDVLWGGLQATPPLKRGQKHAPITPFDGNDVLAGENGFDQLDGGNGDNVMDAGADFIRETMVGSGGWDTAYIHKDEGKFQDVLKNHSKRYTLIPYGSMPVPAVPPTPVDCDSPIIVNVPNPLSGAQSKPSPKKPVKTQRPLPKGASRIGKR
jgi:Ca2+-binding RTX toxin-like protein